ncbi:YTH domain-containing protein [Cephalotus follicularis]|uniref:YTH domain-containing family protein n=1 Tax=Cephalotus follicularis TaxID=3775 RepID=A0A1Q3CHK8_CEPFO|nr:YTH domain-containing protein [Cephalotus follicularis]
MSSDTAKENASVVDSSVTEWKSDMGNSDDPESSSYKVNEDDYISRVKEEGHSPHQLRNSTANRKGKFFNVRYFIIKSLNHYNIQLSMEKGIWATQVMNEPILEEAFHNSSKVILIFSVNMSGFFQGYAQMMSPVGWRRDNVWSQGSGKGNSWGGSFKVKWLRLNDLPFQKTLHLKNPLNDYKPVKISRDCQELPEDIGEALCELLDGNGDVDGTLTSFPRDDLSSKKPFMKSPCFLEDEEYNVTPSHMSWARMPMPHPSFLYQHQAEASRFQFAHNNSAAFTEILPPVSRTSEVGKTRNPCIDGNLTKLQVDRETPSRIDVWGLPAESPLASTLSEDEFLEMSYEEYLEVQSRSIRRLCLPVAGTSWPLEDSLRSKKDDDDLNPTFVADRSRSRKRARYSPQK